MYSKCEIKKEAYHLERDNIQIPFMQPQTFSQSFTNTGGGISVYPDKCQYEIKFSESGQSK